MRTLGLIVLLALLAGVPNLPRAMHGDQVFALLGAESLARGELLYRDFWDIRQPGLFVIYWMAGKLFGFDEIGLHLFDLLFWLAFAVFVSFTWPRLIHKVTLADASGSRNGARSVSEGEFYASPSVWPALTTSGWYWAVTGGVQQMQPEAMVGPILYLHLWLLLRRSRTGWAMAGVVAAIVLLLKLMYLPLLGIAVLFAILRVRRGQGWRAAIQITGIYVLSCVLAFSTSHIPWIVAGELDIVKRTYFDYPPQMLAELPRPSIDRLVDAAKWFGTRYGPLFVLAAIGGVRLWQDRKREWLLFLLLWLVTGTVVIVAQRFSWWSYHFMLLALPVGLLAAEGCSACIKRGRIFEIGTLVVLLLPMVAATALKWEPISRHKFCLASSDREAMLLQEDVYRTAEEETAFLREPTSRPGPIFIAGEPIFYRYAGRTQATAFHGWSLELYPAEVRLDLSVQLANAKPAYLFIDRVYYAKLVEERYPILSNLLGTLYRILRQSSAGTWYELIR